MINLTKYNLLKYTPHNSPIRKQNIKHFTLQPSRFAACPDERRGPGHPRRTPPQCVLGTAFNCIQDLGWRVVGRDLEVLGVGVDGLYFAV